MNDRRQFVTKVLGAILAPGLSVRALGAEPVTVQRREFTVPLLDSQGRIQLRYFASALSFIEDLGEGVGLEVGLIPGGDIQMGSLLGVSPAGQPKEQPVHRIVVKPFGMGTVPVTRRQWQRVSSLP